MFLAAALAACGGEPRPSAARPGPASATEAPPSPRPAVIAGTCFDLEAATEPPDAGAPRPCTPIDPVLTGVELEPLEQCFRAALERDPGLATRLVARAGDAFEVTGNSDEALLTCATGALAMLAGAGDRVCSYALLNPDAAPSVPEAVRLDVTAATVYADGKSLIDTADIDDPDVLLSARRTLDAIIRTRLLQGRRPIDPPDPGKVLVPRYLALRAHPALDAGTVLRVRDAIVAGASLRSLLVARAIGTSDAWLAVNPLGTPDYGCAPEQASATLRLDPDAALVAGARVPLRDGDFDPAALGGALAGAATGPRTDLLIEVAPQVRFRTLASAVETAIAAGFVDLRVELAR